MGIAGSQGLTIAYIMINNNNLADRPIQGWDSGS